MQLLLNPRGFYPLLLARQQSRLLGAREASPFEGLVLRALSGSASYRSAPQQKAPPHEFYHQARRVHAVPLQLRPRFLSTLRGGGKAGGLGQQGSRHLRLELSGLTCGSCIAKAEHALLCVEGVLEATVNLATSQASVTTVGDGHAPPASAELIAASEAAGFPARELWDTSREGARVFLDVRGLKCGGCVSKGEAALMGVPGVQAANMNLATSTAMVTLAGGRGPTTANQANLVAALASVGFSSDVVRVSSNLESEDPNSMSSEEERVVTTPAQRHGREVAESRRRLQISLLLLAVSAATHLGHHGHHLLQLGGVAHVPSLSGWLLPAGWFDWLQAGIATAALVGPGSTLIKSGLSSLRRLSPDMNSLVSTGVLAVYLSSLVALLKPSLGLATTFHEPVMLLGAVLLGRSLEARQRLKAAQGLQTLFDVRPDQARLVDTQGSVNEIPAAHVRVGDTVEILPGDRFPVDGLLVEGRTAADESSLTGEPTPVAKGPGDVVRAGTLSATDGGAVRITATATASRSMLASVIALVEDAQARKVPIQRLADTIAGKFTWVVLAASVSTFAFWGALSPSLFGLAASAPAMVPATASATVAATTVAGKGAYPALAEALGGGSAWTLGARLAVDVCLVACPCSLGLATPTAVLVGTGVAAGHGLLLKGADVLETARKVSTVVFDKTGTLTTGKPSITGVVSLHQEWDEDKILQVAAAVERGCRHPLAEAVVLAAEEGPRERLARPYVEELRTVPGLGASARVKLGAADDKLSDVHVGSPRYMREEACVNDTSYGEDLDPAVRRLLSTDESDTDSRAHVGAVGKLEGGDAAQSHKRVTERLSAGQTAIVVAVEGRAIGLIFAADEIRPATSVAVAELAKRGVSVRVASGDRREAVWAAAAAAGVPKEATSWAATPGDKASLVRSLQAQGEVVMIVGDGVNDAPALAAADVGVAMRAGTAAAMDAADVVLMRDDVRGVTTAIDVSRLTLRKVRTNLLWALGYNIVAIPLAAGAFLPGWGVMLSPAMAGAIMSCSSIAVVTNSLLLRRTLERKM